METKKKRLDDTIIDMNPDFLKEIMIPDLESKITGHVFVTEYKLWNYKKTTTMRLFWLNKKTWIHELVEIKWQCYIKENLCYPISSFANYILTQKWGAHFEPDNIEAEIRIWFEIRNKILQ